MPATGWSASLAIAKAWHPHDQWLLA
jgi:hypothetical protein